MSQPLPPEPEDSYKGGFGAPIRKEVPKPVAKSKPRGDYGIVEIDGKMKTTRDNLPRSAIDEAIEQWAKAWNADVGQDFLP